MKTFAKIIREGQKFYIQHAPSRGEYDSNNWREGTKKNSKYFNIPTILFFFITTNLPKTITHR